jgi:hypothetical protein
MNDFYTLISENLCNIGKIIDQLGGNERDNAIRLYIDAELTIIHRMARNLDVRQTKASSAEYLNRLKE